MTDAGLIVELSDGRVAVSQLHGPIFGAMLGTIESELRHAGKFAMGAGCRQQQILRYFGDRAGPACGHCDNCRQRGVSPAEQLRTVSRQHHGAGQHGHHAHRGVVEHAEGLEAAVRERVRHQGMILMGLGLIFFGMGVMGDAMDPLRSSPFFIDLMKEMGVLEGELDADVALKEEAAIASGDSA